MTKANSNRLIRLFEELGPEFFHLSQVIRISAQEFRALGPAVKDGALHRNGEAIALIPENSEKIAEAMADFRAETGGAPSPIAALPSLEKHGLKLAQEFGEMLRRGPSDDHRAQIKTALGGVLRALHRVEIDHR